MKPDIRKSGPGLRTFIGAALISGAAACGNLTAGGATGEALVVISGDAADVAPAMTVASASVMSPGSQAQSDGTQTPQASTPARGDDDGIPEGEVEAEFRIFLENETGELLSLTDTDIRVRVDLEGVRESEVADRVVPAARYTGFQIVFTEIEAEVDAGLIINGVPVIGAIEVELENISLTVTKPLDLTIGDQDRVSLLIDLNAASWLQAVDPLTAVVDAQVFADLVTVVVR